MKLLTLPRVVSQPSVIRAPVDHATTNPEESSWSALQLVDDVFCRAFPSLSTYLYALLGEDVAGELDE